MQVLARGQKVRLEDLSGSLQGRVQLRAVAPGLSLDFSCFGVDEAGKLSDDRYFIFYNQPSSPEGALKLGIGQPNISQSFDFDLSKLPNTIRRLAFTITIDGEGEMRQLQSGHFLLSLEGREAARFSFSGDDFSGEKALIVGEVYFKDVWRVAAVGQGFSGGLSALLKHFGGEEDASPSSSPQATSTSRAPNPPRSSQISPTPSTSSVRPVPLPPPAVVPAPTVLSASSFPLPLFSPRQVGPDTCVRCGRGIGFVEKMRGGFNDVTRRCRACEEAVAAALLRLRTDFITACGHGLSPQRWQQMWEGFNPTLHGVPPAQALGYISGDSLRFVDQLVAMAAAEAGVSAEEERLVSVMLQVLAISPTQATRVRSRIESIKTVARIRQGHLPLAPSEHHLEAGEVCHLEAHATYHKQNARSVSIVSGRLIATSKKLHFLSPSGGRTILYKNIMRVAQDAGSVHLQLSTSSGAGRYDVHEPHMTEAIITTLTKMAKRQMLQPQDGRASRRIPQDVKLSVWQRDGGACVQCSAKEYLEYDHVIPHSRGGASTLNNVQLLCRKCNLDKSDRI